MVGEGVFYGKKKQGGAVMLRKDFEVAGARFEVVEKSTTPWGTETVWRNVNYSGNDDIVIYGSSGKLENLIERLISEKPEVLQYVAEIYLKFWRNPTTGLSGSSEGYIRGDRAVLGRLIRRSSFKWVDKAQGISVSALEIDEEFLRSFK